MPKESISRANGVVYWHAPTTLAPGNPRGRKRIRTVWWRYELCENYTLEFATKYGMALRENPSYDETLDGSLYTISERQLTAFRGFQWDGATGPTLQPKSSVRATLVHDVMCAAIARGILLGESRANADLIFREILKEDGMSKVRSSVWYLMVDTFG